MPKKKRLLWQLYPSYLLITLISLLAATWFSSVSLKRFAFERNVADLETRASLIEAQVIRGLAPLQPDAVDRLCKRLGERTDTRITVILPSGKVVGDSFEAPENMDNHLDRPEVIKAFTDHVGVSKRYSRTLDEDMMYVGIPLREDGRLLAVVRMSLPLTSLDEAMRSIEKKIAFGGLIIAALAAMICLLVSRRISRPLEEMEKGARLFAGGDLGHRLRTPKTEEMSGLAEALNQMAAQLDERISTVIRQRRELEAVLSSMIEGVIGVDMEERVISLNPAAARIFECDPAEVQGRNLQEVVRNPDLRNFLKEALSVEAPVEKDIRLYGDDERILNGHGTMLQDAGGGRVGALIVLNDVTRLRRLENVRKEFVSNVSHEIKTPITAIKGFVETLQDTGEKTPEESRRFLEIIRKHVERLEAIVEDLLSLSRIEQDAGRKDIVLTEEKLWSVLKTAVQICEKWAEEKKIKINLTCVEDIGAEIVPPLLEQAVVNLLDNAIKYSEPEKPIHVEAVRTDRETIIHVRDQGRGIAKEHLPRVFERFYRVDKARSRNMGGTGLGLAIVKHIIKVHGGRVEVESTLGKGSTFSIILPKA